MNKKRLSVLALLIAVCLLMAGCNFGVLVHNGDTAINDQTVILQETSSSEETATTSSPEEADSTAKTSEAESGRTTTSGKSGTDKTSTTAQTGTTKKRQGDTTTQSDTTKKQQGTTAATEKQTTETKKSTDKCSVTIECQSILSHMDQLKEGPREYVPSDGYLLKAYRVKYREGDTAYDILKRACEENGLLLNARQTQYGTYVAGINNLDEKDCGSRSGWL